MPLKSDRPDASIAGNSLPRLIVRVGGRLLLVLVAGFCLLLLAIRFIVFPQIQTRQAQIAEVLAHEIGQPVEIGALATGWDGWNPRLDVMDFRIGDPAAGGSIVKLPAVQLTVAWTSLLVL
jgi:uncharacterized protein YhdP